MSSIVPIEVPRGSTESFKGKVFQNGPLSRPWNRCPLLIFIYRFTLDLNTKSVNSLRLYNTRSGVIHKSFIDNLFKPPSFFIESPRTVSNGEDISDMICRETTETRPEILRYWDHFSSHKSVGSIQKCYQKEVYHFFFLPFFYYFEGLNDLPFVTEEITSLRLTEAPRTSSLRIEKERSENRPLWDTHSIPSPFSLAR